MEPVVMGTFIYDLKNIYLLEAALKFTQPFLVGLMMGPSRDDTVTYRDFKPWVAKQGLLKAH